MRGVGDRIELDDSIVTAVLRALRAEHPDQRARRRAGSHRQCRHCDRTCRQVARREEQATCVDLMSTRFQPGAAAWRPKSTFPTRRSTVRRVDFGDPEWRLTGNLGGGAGRPVVAGQRHLLCRRGRLLPDIQRPCGREGPVWIVVPPFGAAVSAVLPSPITRTSSTGVALGRVTAVG